MGLLRYLWTNIFSRDDNIFAVSVEKQKSFLSRLPVAYTDEQRSYNQYCCQMYLMGYIKKTMVNIVAFPLLLYYIFKLYIVQRKVVHDIKKSDCVAILDGKDKSIITEELLQEFDNWHYIADSNEGMYLTEIGRSYFLRLLRQHTLSAFFLLKCLMKIGMYGYLIESYQPKAIVCCNEYSYTSSVLTRFCELSNLEHIDVMHGEKIYYIRDSFFRYHRCYVWQEEYIDLFKLLYADVDQFIISEPRSLKFSMGNEVNKKYDYIYYLGNEGKDEICRIVDLLLFMNRCGKRVALRPHPRWSDLEYISHVVKGISLDNPKTVGIEQSILSTENVVSLYSTVLTQAYHNGVNVVIDDITDLEKYKKLHELRYMMLNVPHKVLSQCITDLENDH